MNRRESELVANLQAVRREVDETARRCGRDPADIGIVAVSKFHPAGDVAALARAGHADFGESYAKEALSKMEALAGGAIRWHFIGGLQSNKAKYVAGRFALIHSVDNLKLAELLARKADSLGLVQPVLLQVNLAGEARKGGVAPGELPGLAEAVAGLRGLDLQGLMIMPPYVEDGEASRPFFAGLREARDRLAGRLGRPLPRLSMGMTHDFVQAVEEGATLIRVGTRIFGERPATGPS